MDDTKNELPKEKQPSILTIGSKTITIGSKIIRVKILVIVLCVLALGGFAYYYKGLIIAATVNGMPISRLSVIQELEKTSAKQVLDAMINKKLIESEAAKKGIAVSDDEIQAELIRVENNIKLQGSTLDAALKSQGLTIDYLKQEIITQKKLEKLLGDKVKVTDVEIDKYIKDNESATPQDRDQVAEQLRQLKLTQEAPILMKSIRLLATIRYFVNY
ncbi:MAG TPA: SurA N-terminal domain-containing protein [Candidatus Paceibacterota bacterium]